MICEKMIFYLSVFGSEEYFVPVYSDRGNEKGQPSKYGGYQRPSGSREEATLSSVNSSGRIWASLRIEGLA